MIRRNGFLLLERAMASGRRSVKDSTKSEKLLPRSGKPDIGQCECRRLHMDQEIQEQNRTAARAGKPNGLASTGRPRKRGRSRVWKTVKQNGFIIALLCAVGLAFLFPSAGAKGGWLQPDLANNIGVALILFVQGLAMAVERMKAGAGNW